MSKIYRFHQNNSFGVFAIDDEVCPNVYVEAKSADEANEKAKQIGIYFDGVANGFDCPCCGDRWSRVEESDAVDELPKEGWAFAWCNYVIFYGKDMKPVKIYKEGK